MNAVQPHADGAGYADPSAVWDDALRAAAVLAVDPVRAGGILLRARSGPVRAAWLEILKGDLPPGVPYRRLPVDVRDDRLLGGLDLAATLKAGRPVLAKGLLADADGGVVVAVSAERMQRETAARLAAVLDRGEVVVERDGLADRTASRFGVVAIDEGAGPDETVVPALADRLAVWLDIDAVPLGAASARGTGFDDVAAARARLDAVAVDDRSVEALCAAALALGVPSLRAPLQALRVAQIAAALSGRGEIDEDALALAGRLVLLPRATRLPAEAADPAQDAPEDRPRDQPDPEEVPRSVEDAESLDDIVVEAAQAVIPADLLELCRQGRVRRRRDGAAGRAGWEQKSARRGRPAGTQNGAPHPAARPNVIETLRAAAPWQKLRRAAGRAGTVSTRVRVAKQDFRFVRLKHRSETVTIFVVDASGSAAAQRLAEAKGAVELLLADCYVRRDQVAVLAFRRQGAELLLPPTRSLTRAKRALAGLPGGGGTPLAAGLDAAATLAEAERRRGRAPVVVVLTDGRANIARDGSVDRAQAADDAAAAGEVFRVLDVPCLLIDTAPRPDHRASRVAECMGATYLPLPFADAVAVSGAVRAVGNARP